jgi:trigger factor
MKVTQEKLPASQVGLEIEITPEMTKKAYEQVIQKFTRSANIPGFRKGKVPRQVLVQRFGAMQLKAAALEELIDESLKAAIQQESLETLGNYQLRSPFEELITHYEPGTPLTFSASVDVPPTVTLAKYTELKVQAEEILFKTERVDEVLENYRTQLATLVPVEDREAQEKDIAVVDFKGILPVEGGEPEDFPGNQAEDFQVELTAGKFIPGFTEGIIGMKPGENREIAINFPDDYPQAELAGRAVVFTVDMKELKTRELPELDDDFAKDVNDEYETLAALRESLEQRFTEEVEDKTRANKEQAILDELLKHVEVDLPETLIDRELDFMLRQTAMQLQNQGLDLRQFFTEDTVAMMKQRSRPDAIDRIKRTLALGEVAKQEKIKAEEAELNLKVEEMLESLGDMEVSRDRVVSVVEEDLLKEKIMDWLLENNTVDLVPEGSLTPAEVPAEALAESSTEALPEASAEVAEDTASEALEAVEAAVEVVTEADPPAKPKKSAAKSAAKPKAKDA